MFFNVGIGLLLSMGIVFGDKDDEERDLFRGYNCWENNVIPYFVGDGFTKAQVDFLHENIKVFHSKTCLRWVDFSPDGTHSFTPKYHLEFLKVDSGYCRTSRRLYSNESVVTYIQLLDHCFTYNTVKHEMMHALGFLHEHQRSDRNCYISIAEGAEHYVNFKIYPHEPWVERYPYDKYSIMHYRRNQYMKSLGEGTEYETDLLGNANGQLTHMDLSKILYKFCGGRHYCDDNVTECAMFAAYRRRCLASSSS